VVVVVQSLTAAVVVVVVQSLTAAVVVVVVQSLTAAVVVVVVQSLTAAVVVVEVETGCSEGIFRRIPSGMAVWSSISLRASISLQREPSPRRFLATSQRVSPG
jgi:hypothetical protein